MMSGDGGSSENLTDDELSLIEAIYKVLRENDRWPTYGYLEQLMERQHEVDIEELAETLPAGLTTLPPGRYPVGDQWEVQLTIEGLLHVGLPGAAEDVELFFRVFRRLIFEKKNLVFTLESQPKPCLTTDGLSTEWIIDKGALKRVFRIVAARPEPWMGDFAGIGDGTNLRICAGKLLRKFQDAKTLDQYLDERRAFFAPSPNPRPFVEVPESPLRPPIQADPSVAPSEEWDVFISHASADLEPFVKALAAALKARGLRVWFNQFTVGDSLRGNIDEGLARSRYGIVVLSPAFFARRWTKAELGALMQRQMEGQKVILPVLHNMTPDQLRKKSPLLADLFAVPSDSGLDQVVTELLLGMDRPSA